MVAGGGAEMTVATISAPQLRSLFETRWQADQDAVALGLHVAHPCQAPDEVEFAFGKAQVVRADTVFQIREKLMSAERNKERIILLTKLEKGTLGNDVVARLARNRLFHIDHFASLCALFKAKELDPLVSDPAIAEALLECKRPPDGFPPVSAGVLDAGTVWRAICRHVFEMGESEPDLVSLLLWATGKSGQARYMSATEALRESLRSRLMNNLGEAAESILRFIENGAGGDALALAVVCQVVFGNGQDSVLDAAAARMEQYHNNKPIPKAVGRVLGRVAVDAIADLDRKEDPRLAMSLSRADELLRQFRCEQDAYRNRITPLGYDQRLARFGDGVLKAVTAPDDDAVRSCEALHTEIANHRIAKLGRRAEQVSRTDMALRLIRWLSSPTPAPTSLSDMVNVYRKELAFVDWARESVCRGEDVPELSAAYQQLDQEVLARRQEFNRAFAQALANWTSVGSTVKDVCGVEDLLTQFVTKVAGAGNRVLFIVLDGMSWAVCHELLSDFRQEHWFEATLDGSSSLPIPLIATVPSVTNYSRASLFSGAMTRGDSAVEKRNFEANKVLRDLCDKRHPPILFHKAEVTEGSRGVLGKDVNDAILETKNRIVGVVINAIDDRLSSAQQIRDDWTINRISPLATLLKRARDSGRVVILASDHGHVWHRPDARMLSSEAGSRWRPNSGDVQDEEIVISGSRVRDDAGQNSVIVPWSETIYYKRQQNGYHGGATPQEMVAPLVILTEVDLNEKNSAYPGLYACEYTKPEWWSCAPVPTRPAEQEAAVVPTRSYPPSLFDELQEEQHVEEPKKPVAQPLDSGWIERLFASAAYKDQKELVRRYAPEDPLVRRCLKALEASGGMMTPAAFSKAAEVPAGRLDGLVARIQRLLNVDGYEILTMSRSENRIELNVLKLKRQFDLE
jgi:hypothetical protein